MVDESEFDEFLSRISKTLYYGCELMEEDHLSYPVIELAAEIYSDLKTTASIDRLYLNEATEMTKKVKVNPCYLVLALLYIERLKDCNAEYLDNVAPSQLFLISLVLASKFHDDSEYELSLSMFEKFSSWSSEEIFDAELSFLNALAWHVHATEAEFYTKLVQIEKSLALRLAGRRHWFTYTEMSTLLDEASWLSHLSSLLMTVSAVCITSYTAAALTLVASTALASHLSTSAALAILSTTAQLSLLLPSTPSQVPSSVDSDANEPFETLDEQLENRIEDMIRRLNDLNEIRDGDDGLTPDRGFGSGTGRKKEFDNLDFNQFDSRETLKDWECRNTNLNNDGHTTPPYNDPERISLGKETKAVCMSNPMAYSYVNTLLYTCSMWWKSNIPGSHLTTASNALFKSEISGKCLNSTNRLTNSCCDLETKQDSPDSILRPLSLSYPSARCGVTATPCAAFEEAANVCSPPSQSENDIPLFVPSTISFPLLSTALTSFSPIFLFDYFPQLTNVSSLFQFGCLEDACDLPETLIGNHQVGSFYDNHINRDKYHMFYEKVNLKY